MEGYIKDTVLSEKALKEAREYASTVDWYGVYQYYNLFDCLRYDIAVEEFQNLGFLKELHTYSRKSHNIGSYLLKYVPGSFCRVHQDNQSELTIVTLLDSTDLIGGDAVVQAIYETRSRPPDLHCARTDREHNDPPYGRPIIPDVVPLQDGESMIYGPDLHHGVSKVYEGSRTALITWFKNGERVPTNEEN